MNLLKCNEVNIISRYDRRRPWEKFSSTKIKYIVSQKPKWLFAHFVFFYLFATASNAVYTPLIMSFLFLYPFDVLSFNYTKEIHWKYKETFHMHMRHLTSYDIIWHSISNDAVNLSDLGV